jgi:hypothetical protein
MSGTAFAPKIIVIGHEQEARPPAEIEKECLGPGGECWTCPILYRCWKRKVHIIRIGEEKAC